MCLRGHQLIIPISVLLAFTLPHCKGFNTGNEPETYTWSGTIYEGLGEQPLANHEIELIYFEQRWSSSAPRSEIIATGQTDANGYFELTYEKFTDKQMGDEDGLWLYVSEHDAVAEYFPWNVDIQRDFAERDHSKVYVVVDILSDTVPDSLFVTVALLIDNEDFIQRVSYKDALPQNAAIVKCEAQKFGFQLLSGWGGLWNNQGQSTLLVYGVNRNDFHKANYPITYGNVPEEYNQIEYQLRGFPFTDTVHLVIE